MSKLFDKEVNAQKESLKNFWGSRKLPQAHEKCVMKMKQREKRPMCKNVINGRKHGPYKKQVKTIWINDSGHNEI